MKIQNQISDKLSQMFNPQYLLVENESANHNVPDGSESHFKVTVVSDEFEGKRLLMRHRAVNKCLAVELAEHIHALAIHTYSPQEWSSEQQVPESPNCLGGSKGDKTLMEKL